MYRTVNAAKLLAFAELVLDSKSYTTADATGDLEIIVGVIVGRGWVEDLTIATGKLIAASVS